MKAVRVGAPLLLLVAAAGCAGPRTRVAPEPASRYEALPTWRYEPLSWEKLEAIEAWLDDVDDAPLGLRAEAELELSEGRLVFARREAGELDPRVLAARLEGCEQGFRRVLDDPTSSRDQRARARSGLSDLELVRGAAATERPSPALVARRAWQARAPDPSRLTPHVGPWSRITIHHTVIEPDGAGLAGTCELLRDIQRNHMDSEGMGDIGYHYLIDPAGNVVEGRDLRWRGAHAGGRNNVSNLGICLIGNFDARRPSPAALRSLARLTDQLRGRHGIARSSVFGHRELKGTACPGEHLQRWVGAYRAGATPVADASPGSGSTATSSSARPATVR